MTTLGNISIKSSEKNTSRLYDVVFTNSAEFGIIDQRDFFDRNIANDHSIQGYYVVYPNNYVYNPRISTIAPVGPINRNKLSYAGVMSPLYYVFKITDKETSFLFLDHYFKSTIWHEFMYLNGNSGARSDRFSISDKSFAELPIIKPKEQREQISIGRFMENYDKEISYSEMKLSKVRNMKQALLQKMFV